MQQQSLLKPTDRIYTFVSGFLRSVWELGDNTDNRCLASLKDMGSL